MNYERPQFFHLMQYARAAEGDVVDMVSGDPDWEPPTALRDGLREYADAEPDEFQYPPSEGLVELREEIAARRNVDPGRIVVTNGTGEANYLAMAAALDRNAGSEVLLADPVYPYYPGKTELLGGDTTLVPTERDGSIDPDRFREAASEDTALVLVNTPNNPTGAVYSRETMRDLADLAAEVDATLVSDEVYDHFDFTGGFESALTLDSDRVIVTSGFSKSMAITGFRVGYAVLPEQFVGGAKTRHMLVNVATSRPPQVAVLRALRGTEPEYYERVRSMLRDRVSTFTDALDVADAEYTTPDGAFYVLARFDGFPGTMANAKRLVDGAGVAGMPGETFGSARAEWFRFALVTPRVEEAATRLADYFS
ncbi:pyridoxal phosphate-dependent aminotransferase [Halorarum salinum]|uniref:Aminotransferase n=1 Tax=Halorarum salinum TaxID=2743089 RepID=A0A7D5L8N5_9EURY|nr:pyridoxal phosphate-dependent aminotransferase [Halobaculum salinum]QLG60570.1 pyridoxal phosphate-dependent aminotransferase [Halobaculum salinum]